MKKSKVTYDLFKCCYDMTKNISAKLNASTLHTKQNPTFLELKQTSVSNHVCITVSDKNKPQKFSTISKILSQQPNTKLLSTKFNQSSNLSR